MCLLDAADVPGWMMIRVCWTLLRLFHVTTRETAPIRLMSSLVRLVSRFVCMCKVIQPDYNFPLFVFSVIGTGRKWTHSSIFVYFP